MGYLPHSEQERRRMLDALGIGSMDELFAEIPEEVRAVAMPELPEPLTEPELVERARKLGAQNRSLDELVCFSGGGIYDRFIPAIVRSVVSRPEFVTPYTPYQPEASQGTLQAMFEYQTMVCELTAMDVANASLYDAATGLGEAILMAASATKRERALISAAAPPAARRTARTYCEAAGISIEEVSFLDDSGATDLEALATALADDVACVCLQQPNFFGVIEQMDAAAELAHDAEALMIAGVEPVSLALLKPPGEYGADIALGEGQALGLPPGFGGPLLGLFACREELVRIMPGRVVGKSQDANGELAYCLTLQTREQHIRRARATSNICTNEGLCALAACVYMAALGPDGLREVATAGARNAHHLRDLIADSDGVATPRFSGDFLNEFVVRVEGSPDQLVRDLCAEGYLGGPALDRDYEALSDCLLLAATECRSREQIEGLVEAGGL